MEINTVRHAVESFRMFMEDRTGRPSSNTFAWPPKLVYYYLNMFRNAVSYEKRLGDSMSNLDEGILLTIPCIELQEVDVTSECPCAPAKGCTWLKSVHPIPKSISGVPHSVLTIDGSTSFDYVQWTQFEDKVVNARLEAQKIQPSFTVRNINSAHHIYLYTNSPQTESGDLISVAVALVPKNPLEVYAFPVCGKKPNESCSPLDQEFTIEEELQTVVFERTFNALMAVQNSGTGADILNNTNNDTKAQAPL
jgi:hypothetical protein